MKLKSALKSILTNRFLLPFVTALVLTSSYMIPLPDLLGGSGDAVSIWETITTFHSEHVVSSYVLYKGFLSVHPYVWLYERASALGLEPFLFIKIYHILLFSLSTAVGVPYIAAKLLDSEITALKSVVVVALVFYLLLPSFIFECLMVDLPSSAFFVATMASTLALSSARPERRSVYSFLTGSAIGLTLCASGQYSLAGGALILYSVATMLFPRDDGPTQSAMNRIFCVGLIVIGVTLPKAYDKYFHATVVQPMRDRGDWLPTGGAWVKSGLTRSMGRYKLSYPHLSNRGMAVVKSAEGRGPSRVKIVEANGQYYTTREYVRILRRHFFDFVVMWATKLFILVSFDGNDARIPYLFVSYSLLFVCLWMFFSKQRYFRDFLTRECLFTLSILSTVAVPVFLMTEPRLATSLESFIVGSAVYGFKGLSVDTMQRVHGRLRLVRPNTIVIYLVFVLTCFALYGAILEIPGSDPYRMLFRWG
jgi:hypothetical protein